MHLVGDSSGLSKLKEDLYCHYACILDLYVFLNLFILFHPIFFLLSVSSIVNFIFYSYFLLYSSSFSLFLFYSIFSILLHVFFSILLSILLRLFHYFLAFLLSNLFSLPKSSVFHCSVCSIFLLSIFSSIFFHSLFHSIFYSSTTQRNANNMVLFNWFWGGWPGAVFFANQIPTSPPMGHICAHSPTKNHW